MSSFIKTIRYSKNAEQMLKRRPTAFLLLFLIAQRARRTNESNFDDLEIGEAMIGDFSTYGQTRQVYRSDLEFLVTFKFVTTRTTNKGTIAKLVDTSIFDINSDESNQQSNLQSTNKQPSTNQQVTTNNNVKNVKKEKNLKNNIKGEESKDSYARFIDFFNSLTGRNFGYTDKKAKSQYEYLTKLKKTREDFRKVILNCYADENHQKNNYKYATPEFVTRGEIFERYLAMGEPKVKSFNKKAPDGLTEEERKAKLTQIKKDRGW